MNRIIKIGMDVHSTNYTLCAMEPVLDGEDRIFTNIQVTPDYENVIQFIDNLKLIHRATNLFDNRTLAIHPYSTIFVAFSAEEKAKMDVLNTTVRLSIGLEDVDDIYNDIKQALT